MRGEPGRTPITIVEIDQDLCSLTYSVLPCEAALGVTGENKCFNTLETCQDTENYDPQSPLTLRFSKSHTELTSGLYTIPLLKSVIESGAKLNQSSRKSESKPLGKRASVTATFQDAPHSDNRVDPYLAERTYDPLKRSTFWAKWLTRNPFYVGRPMRVRSGYLGQALIDFKVSHYVIDSINGPDSNGNVVIKGLDILRLADDDKAQAPQFTPGNLSISMDAGSSSITMSGALESDFTDIIGSSDRKAVLIDDEVITYETVTTLASGEVKLDSITRAQEGTEGSEHEVGSHVQRCLIYDRFEGFRIAYDLITNFTDISPSHIDLAAWEDEAHRYSSPFLLSRVITEPVGITKLLGELGEQALFYLWWDIHTQQVRFRAVQPVPPGSIFPVTEDRHLIQGKTSVTRKPDERVSEVWVSFDIDSAISNPDEFQNYQRTFVRVDPTAAGPEEYGARKVYKINSPWLIDESQAELIGFRVLQRFRDPPTYVTFQLDAKDRDIELGDVVDITWRSFVDFLGSPLSKKFEIIQKEEVVTGETYQYIAQEYLFTGRYAFLTENDEVSYSLASDLESKGFFAPDAPPHNFANGDEPYVFV